ncbi:MAG: HAD-IC family P-type ATPase, partial [Dehalococcoidales bacterium]|nr:HAD-IC family P-type ATPase [Dehalococcoidales bacterium]
ALQECQQAGIRLIMITGDHPVTAHAVAEGLGLPHEDINIGLGEDLNASDEVVTRVAQRVNIFARTQPEQKYRLVEALQGLGHVVAMTGDGINDAPALRKADIGIAMGEHGTEVAREAANLVLLDDNFATIVGAIKNGRRIFDNLRRAFSYLIAFHVPLLLAALIIPVIGLPLLLLPIHLIWFELVVHPTAALTFEGDPASPDTMRRPPRPPRTGILLAGDFARVFVEGTSLFLGVFALYVIPLSQGASVPQARALAITTLLLGQMLIVLGERSSGQARWRTGLRGNRSLPAVLAATLASLLLALYVPPVTRLVDMYPLSLGEWGIAGAVALVSVLWLEPLKGRLTNWLAPSS